MRLGLLLIFIAVPLVELALLIKVGQSLGIWATLAIVVGTAIAGTMVLHRQGWQVMNRAMESAARGVPPIEPVIDGSFLLVAGALLLTPGLITDAMGLALLVPAFRQWVAHRIFRAVIARGDIKVDVRTSRSGPFGQESEDGYHPRRNERGGQVIEGEYETIEDPKPDKKPPGQRQ